MEKENIPNFPMKDIMAGCLNNPTALIALPARQLLEMIESVQVLMTTTERPTEEIFERVKKAFF